MGGQSVYATAEPAIHQALQTGFDIAATDERCVDLGCIYERSLRPVF
jgi:hypothetical protein